MDSKKVKCPHCGAESDYSLQNPFRPFCSERCRIIDLGAWANESYRIANLNKDFSEELPEEINTNENFDEDQKK